MKRRFWVLPLAAMTGVATLTAMIGGCAMVFGDPEGGSGPDAYRHQAAPMALDELLTDSVGIDDGDQTDWREIEMNAGGRVSVSFSADDRDAEILVGLFDRYGAKLRSIERDGGQTATLTVDVPRGGRYFLMVQAVSGPPTGYSLEVSVGPLPASKRHNSGPGNRPGF